MEHDQENNVGDLDDLAADIEAAKQHKRDINNRYYARVKERMSAGEITERNKKWRKRWEARVGRKALTKRALAARLRRQELSAGPKPTVCDVCDRGGRIVFDHCHHSDAFRGWICHNCNVVLGLVNDDPEILTKLAAYLGKV